MKPGDEESHDDISVSLEVKYSKNNVIEEDLNSKGKENDTGVPENLTLQLEEKTDSVQENKNKDQFQEYHDQNHENEKKDDECPFCVFMKLGPCGKSFSAWENCIDEAEKEGSSVMVEKCALVTGFLTECMKANVNYYGPVLETEKIVDAEVSLKDAPQMLQDTVEEKKQRPAEEMQDQAVGNGKI